MDVCTEAFSEKLIAKLVEGASYLFSPEVPGNVGSWIGVLKWGKNKCSTMYNGEHMIIKVLSYLSAEINKK